MINLHLNGEKWYGNIYSITCKIDSQGERAVLWELARHALASLEVEREVREVQEGGDIHIPVADSC